MAEAIDGKRLLAEMTPHTHARKWLAHDSRRVTDCLVYVFEPVEERERLWRYLELCVGARRRHTLQIESAGRERGGVVWASTPYPGNHSDIVTLEGLRRSKGGSLAVYEVARAVEQLLGAVSGSHEAGSVHGAISPDEVLVTPRGTLLIEMYGLARAVAADPGRADEARRDEIRSVVEIAWRLLTGADAAEREIFATQAKRSLDREWARWLEEGLEPAHGFADASEALDRLPGRGGASIVVPAGGARSWLDRLSSAVTHRRETPGGRGRKSGGGTRA